ncbi:MAG: hypothetical protein L3K23_02130 [Thermoplasmata archaeon]|nr:hypothetical protein [Thermoplasmata archaeon]
MGWLPAVDPTTLGYWIAIVAAAGSSLGGTALGYYLSRRQTRETEHRAAAQRARRSAVKLVFDFKALVELATALPPDVGDIENPSKHLEPPAVPLLQGAVLLDAFMDLPKDLQSKAMGAMSAYGVFAAKLAHVRQVVWNRSFDSGGWTKEDSQSLEFVTAYHELTAAKKKVLEELPPVIDALAAIATE